jgi:hypothetical protein
MPQFRTKWMCKSELGMCFSSEAGRWFFSQLFKSFSSKPGRYSTTKQGWSSKWVKNHGRMTITFYQQNHYSAGSEGFLTCTETRQTAFSFIHDHLQPNIKLKWFKCCIKHTTVNKNREVIKLKSICHITCTRRTYIFSRK